MKNTLLALVGVCCGFLYSCTEVEPLSLQNPYEYDEAYYRNLREYKASDHQVCFGWLSDIAFTHCPGCRFLGIPDSLDICSLWGGIPSDVPGKHNTFYNPQVHEEMRFVQKVKGTKMIYVTFPGVGSHPWLKDIPEDKRVQAFGDSLLRVVYDNDLDGLDLDYEISGDWMHGENFVELIKYLGAHIGPKGKDSSKILCVDYWADPPYSETEPYVNYFVKQAYTKSSSGSTSSLDNMYSYVSWIPTKKFIVTESVAETPSGGALYTEYVDGNRNDKSLVFSGEPLRSIEAMARWNPEQGKKGGFGGFCIQYDYNNQPGYKYIRMGIQLQNPSKK